MSTSMSGRTVARRGQEALEEQVQLHRVGVGDAERVTDRRVRGRTAALAVDVVAATELGDVPDGEEVAGEAEGLDDAELVVDLSATRPRPARPRACRSASWRPQRRALPDRTARRCPSGVEKRGQVRARPGEGRRPARSRVRRPRRRPRASARSAGAARRRCAGARAGLALCQPSISSRLWRARSAASTLARAKASRRGVVHVVRRHESTRRDERQFGQDVVARDVIGRAVVPDLDRDVVATEARR